MDKQKSLIIGISGVATVGKDLFCKLFIKRVLEINKNLKIRKYALADKLKDNLSYFLYKNFGIDIYECTPQEKELIRPILVEYGKIKRIQTNGTYWTLYLEQQINQENPDIALISDIRYSIYPEDEAWWLRKHMGGILVHLKKFRVENGEKIFTKPANKDEDYNDPIIEKYQTDYHVSWEDSNGNSDKLLADIDEFLFKINIYTR